MKLLHIFAQYEWHSNAYIVGNTEALKTLRKAIDKALETGHALTPKKDCVFAADGEGYSVHIVKNDDEWTNIALPYTDEIAGREVEGQINPWDMIPEEHQTNMEEGPGLEE